ncbi:sensor histidine kinase [Pontiella agarivorans]|uniref:histidine kinase n=1 Tax=Pontiella agarivorans TaxID=3038953 RepID=A0ABU5MV66_9BACT|nr:hybrid sensor histidine kinase/response regulator [Pontiella agarivorans]MDZ8118050.1 hybrid sensor histidine kinase/response regulator [Pontiella agarivorans]
MIADCKDKKGKVLVIDDERGPRESLRMVLKYDYDMVLAERVDAGINALREHNPDLVIMDIRMPEKSGIEGLQEIREINPNVSIVMLTGYGDLETAQQAIRYGANDYLQKPFDTDEIQAVVKKYVDRTKLNSRKKQAQEELNKMTQSLSREVGKTNKLTSLGAASSELVRDLRNPLTIIRGYLDLLNYELKEKRDSTSDEMSEYLDQIERNVERCAELVESWRALGRFDFSQMQRVNLPKLMNDCFRDAAAHSEISFSVQVDGAEDQYEMLGERLQIKRALQNLIDNAVTAVDSEFAPGITVEFSLSNSDIDLKVKDNGCGVDTSTLRWIFEPFDNTATIEKGAGLGLFITKKVLEEHRGSLVFESRVGEGSIVSVRVPQAHTALGYFSSPASLAQA